MHKKLCSYYEMNKLVFEKKSSKQIAFCIEKFFFQKSKLDFLAFSACVSIS